MWIRKQKILLILAVTPVTMGDRKPALEKELMGEVIDNQQRTMTGKTRGDGTRDEVRNREAARVFGIRQGFRRREAHEVLRNYQGVTMGMEHAGSMWEAALNFDRDVLPVPDEARNKLGANHMANQMGLVETANINFGNSKNKLSQLHLVGS